MNSVKYLAALPMRFTGNERKVYKVYTQIYATPTDYLKCRNPAKYHY